ncbi:P-loop containing nucleoside triphosphate hydrolase protein, partial [Crepidotus variabilis]
MDDDLVLNLAVDDVPLKRQSAGNKGGRWTDRLKVKRSLKRKAKINDKATTKSNGDLQPPPRKKVRVETHQSSSVQSHPRAEASTSTHSRPTQVISSLFSYNPKVEKPTEKQKMTNIAAPSNAPLDSSTFTGLNLNPLIISHLTSKMGIQKPTAIQRASLPVLLSEAKSSRDVFLQSQTGSGKTLSYLLPIIQDLLPLSSLSYIDRSIGTLAIIIAPTRELAKQISDVLESLLKMRLRPEDESSTEPDTSTRLTRWLVSGLLVGGATRTHEKARLRKGVPILVSTPGRLLDHLQNTSSFNVGKCQWLILDEADQLMELGFEETIQGIISGLDGRRRLAKQAMEEGAIAEVGGWDWGTRRRTILCSATIREDVQKLAGTALIEPLMIKATEGDKDQTKPGEETFTPPSQLLQKYIVAPLKLRLVALVALLRTLVAQSQVRKGTKIIVFLSCTDSVDFHWNLLAGSSMGSNAPQPSGSDSNSTEDEDGDEDEKGSKKIDANPDKVESQCALLPDVSIYRLHGSLTTHARLTALKGFAGKSKTQDGTTSVLFCTSVASRGLDLPLVRAVIQYDLPTEGGVTEYVHRVGRTARAGKGGEAWSFVAPSESGWVKWAEEKMQSEEKAKEQGAKASLHPVSVEEILKNGFGGKGIEYEARATEVQLAFERWVLKDKDHASFARKAYLSHMRAYATHPTNEKHIFHIRNLHIGHLAKAFALRDAPKAVNGPGSHKSSVSKSSKTKLARKRTRRDADDSEDEVWQKAHSGEAEKRMQAVVRAQGKLTKKGGIMTSSGASEFQISGAAELEGYL